jgi:hypothetical protein
MNRAVLLLLVLAPAALAGDKAIREAVTFYASFDEAVKGDVGGGALLPLTRLAGKEKGSFTVKKGINDKLFRIAKGKGIAGGALEVVGVLPDNGRIFFPAKGNLAYNAKGWAGSLSMWCKTNPDTMLKTRFCDPVQITEKGANNGGLWFDFNDKKPRDLRHGAFPAIPPGKKGISEDDPAAPMVRVPKIGWKADDWHHVVLTWKNLDTGKPDAETSLYIDGKLIGQVKDRPLAMNWDVNKAGVYVAVNYIGLIDEMALFRRALTADEVKRLKAAPGLLSVLKPGKSEK